MSCCVGNSGLADSMTAVAAAAVITAPKGDDAILSAIALRQANVTAAETRVVPK